MTDKPKTGIEYSFVHSWEGWDEHGPNDLYFYDVKLRQDVFPKELIDQVGDREVDLCLTLSKSQLEVWFGGENAEEPIYTKKIKLIFSEG